MKKWVMALCCIIPAVAVLVVRFYLKMPIPGWLYFLALISCPLSMALMGLMGGHRHQEAVAKVNETQDPKFNLNVGHEHHDQTSQK